MHWEDGKPEAMQERGIQKVICYFCRSLRGSECEKYHQTKNEPLKPSQFLGWDDPALTQGIPSQSAWNLKFLPQRKERPTTS